MCTHRSQWKAVGAKQNTTIVRHVICSSTAQVELGCGAEAQAKPFSPKFGEGHDTSRLPRQRRASGPAPHPGRQFRVAFLSGLREPKVLPSAPLRANGGFSDYSEDRC